MPLRPDLLAAYQKALYVVHGAPELVIRIGEPNDELDELLEADGLDTAAYLTAANPGGELQSKMENELACAALHQALADAGCICYVGEGRGSSILMALSGAMHNRVRAGYGGDYGWQGSYGQSGRAGSGMRGENARETAASAGKR